MAGLPNQSWPFAHPGGALLAPLMAALGLGLALASAPGPVQAVLLAESVRGGTARGLRALAGANATFGLLLVTLALGLSIAVPGGFLLRALEVAGGAFLIWLTVDGRTCATLNFARCCTRAGSETSAT